MTSTVRGSLPPAIYWRRRVFVLALVLAIVFTLVSLVRGGGDRSPDARATTTATTVDPSADSADDAGRHARRAERRALRRAQRHSDSNGSGRKGSAGQPEPDTQGPTAGPTAPTLVEPSGTCDDEDIAVVPRVDPAVAGQPVTIQLRLRTLTSRACTWRMSSKHLALKITDGSDEIWTSRECRFGIPLSNVVVRRDLVTTVPMTWNGLRSEPTCPKLSRPAMPGDYTVSASTLGGEPAESVFDLASPARPVITLPPRHTPPKDKKSTDR